MSDPTTSQVALHPGDTVEHIPSGRRGTVTKGPPRGDIYGVRDIVGPDSVGAYPRRYLRLVERVRDDDAPTGEHIREAVRDELAHWPIDSGYYATRVDIDEASEMANAVLAVVAKYRDAEVERLRAALRSVPGYTSPEAFRIAVGALVAERDDAQDRIARALAALDDLTRIAMDLGEPRHDLRVSGWQQGADIRLRTILTETKEQS